MKKQNCKILPLTLLWKESRTCQKFPVTTLLWQIISFYESRIDTAQRLRVLRPEWAKHRSRIKPGRGGTGHGKGRFLHCFSWSDSEELVEQHLLGRGPGHWSVTPKGLLWQPTEAGDFTALGKKLKQGPFPVKFSSILIPGSEKCSVHALVLIFITQGFSPALVADKMCVLQEQAVGKPQ